MQCQKNVSSVRSHDKSNVYTYGIYEYYLCSYFISHAYKLNSNSWVCFFEMLLYYNIIFLCRKLISFIAAALKSNRVGVEIYRILFWILFLYWQCWNSAQMMTFFLAKFTTSSFSPTDQCGLDTQQSKIAEIWPPKGMLCFQNMAN